MGGPQYPKKETTLWPFPRWKTHLQWKVRVIWQKSRQEEEALSRLKEKKKPNLKVWARAQASQVKVVKHHQRKAAVWECSFNLHHQRNKRPGYNLQTLPEIVKKIILILSNHTQRKPESRPAWRRKLKNRMQTNPESNTSSSLSLTMISSQLNTKFWWPARSQLSSRRFGRWRPYKIKLTPRLPRPLRPAE